MTTLREITSQGEIDYLINHDLILPEHADEEASEVEEENGATYLTVDGDLVIAVYPQVAPDAWRKE